MRKRLLRKLTLTIVPFIASLLMRLIYISAKKRFYLASALPEGAIIFAFWHGNLLLQPFVYHHLRKHGRANVMISEHFDGRLIAKTMRFFGLGTIAGSTTKGGARVLRAAISTIKSGVDIGITPDGPKGPRHEIAPGVLAIAKITHVPIVTFYVQAASKWQLKSWDAFEIPKPFTHLNIFISAPIYPNDEGFEAQVKAKMMQHVS